MLLIHGFVLSAIAALFNNVIGSAIVADFQQLIAPMLDQKLPRLRLQVGKGSVFPQPLIHA